MNPVIVVLLTALLLPPALFVPQARSKKIKADEFRRLMQKVAGGWNEGDARRAADCFAVNAIYTEPPDKQIYRGREALFKFFGGTEGRKQQMKMSWHHLVFDEQSQIGSGEFTFEYGGSRVHGVVMIKVTDGLISNWREYFYESNLAWDKFVGENKF